MPAAHGEHSPASSSVPKILIAGVGNVLRQDDGFGVEVVLRLLEQGPLPEGVKAMETGIGGIHIVQELMDGYDALLLIDAVSRGGAPGQLYLLEADVEDIRTRSLDEQHDFLADMHYSNPTRALMLAKALNVLPSQVYILGCETAAHDDFALGLSPAVLDAVPPALDRIDAWVAQLSREKPDTVEETSAQDCF